MNRDAANLEVHATVLPRGHCGFLAQFTARRGQWIPLVGLLLTERP
jgi:hypothetical protein